MSESERKQRLVASMARSMEAEGFDYDTVKEQIQERLQERRTNVKASYE